MRHTGHALNIATQQFLLMVHLGSTATLLLPSLAFSNLEPWLF